MKSEHKIIPSPYLAVSQFEKQMISIWNENTSKCISEVLKYIAEQI